MYNLNGKVALVTGGARDIGRQTSIKLASLGSAVCINYFDNPEDANETMKMITENDGKAMIVQGDMTKQEDIQELLVNALRILAVKYTLWLILPGDWWQEKPWKKWMESFGIS